MQIRQYANTVLIFQEKFMQAPIRKMGKSQGILIPKTILKQLGLVDVADLQVNGNVIIF